MPFDGMMQASEMLCQITISLNTEMREGDKEGGRKGGKQGLREKEKRTFASLIRRCPHPSVIATDRNLTRSTRELVAGFTRVARNVVVFGAVY